MAETTGFVYDLLSLEITASFETFLRRTGPQISLFSFTGR